MEALVQEKILSSFVNEVSVESETIKPINVDIKTINVTRMVQIETMVTNDGDYFIKYGGFPTSGNYNAIEVYSINSLDNNKAVYIFDDIKIDNHSVYINKLKQSEDGRAIIVRAYEFGNTRTNTKLSFGFPVDKVVRCNMLEEELEEFCMGQGGLPFAIKPFEVVTFKIFAKE